MPDTYTCRRGHTQEIVFDENYSPRCNECLNASRRVGSGKKLDGFEEEFGPIPKYDPYLVDWVVLWRTFKNKKTPRKLTRGETPLIRQMGLYPSSKNNQGIYGGGNVRDVESTVLSVLRSGVYSD